MSNPIISIIIPMYNAKKYVEHCIEGLLAQTFSDVEIILIDDCSTDGCYELAQERFGDNPKFVLLKQEKNGGPALARNAGMKRATGEYITFVDCDDALVDDALEVMYQAAREHNAQIVHTTGCLMPVIKPMPDDLYSVPADNLMVNIQDKQAPSGVSFASDDIQTRVDDWLLHKYQGNVWGKLYKRSFLEDNDIRFADLKLSEDQIFCFECLLRADRYVQIPKQLNIYRIESDSLSRGAKTPAYMEKVLRATFSASTEIVTMMKRIPFFTEHPDYIEKINAYTQGAMERRYIRPSYTRTDNEAMKADPKLHALWEEFFGDNGPWVESQFYGLHDSQPEVPDFLGEMNTVAFWEKVKNGEIKMR
ncbi:MAG: glycosyltransferase family 2 protein [Eubacterium sp.]|nr:glycosyltransferase family 2 protein [Eubacterium sp.]